MIVMMVCGYGVSSLLMLLFVVVSNLGWLMLKTVVDTRGVS